jgi:hypothetical protein
MVGRFAIVCGDLRDFLPLCARSGVDYGKPGGKLVEDARRLAATSSTQGCFDFATGLRGARRVKRGTHYDLHRDQDDPAIRCRASFMA